MEENDLEQCSKIESILQNFSSFAITAAKSAIFEVWTNQIDQVGIQFARKHSTEHTEMEVAVVFLLCAVAAVSGQMMGPMSGMGMGMGWGSPMWHGGVRYPGMMQTSQLNTMTYPTWRSHPIFRMVSGVSDKNVGSDVVNVAKVPPAHEVLTHMALASTNPKPYVDTIADFLYEPQKARAMMPSVASVGPVGTVSSVPPVTQMAPVYMQGMGMMRTMPNVGDDCGQQEGTRWERGLDWLY